MYKKITISILGVFLLIGVAQASTILFPIGGGTGTSTTPTLGQILVGNSVGTYSLQSTSTLGFPSFSYASSTFPSFTYASSSFVTYPYASTTFSSFSYGSSTYYFASNPSNYITSAGAPVQSVSNSDNTLTVTPTTGTVIASLNLAHPNTWTGQQTFNISTTSTSTGTISLSRTTASTQSEMLNFMNGLTSDGYFGRLPNSDDLVWGFNLGGGFLEKMRLTSANGFLGIGTTTPDAKIAVYGGGGSNPVQVSSSTNARMLTLNQSGALNVGAGQRSATQADVANGRTLALSYNTIGDYGVIESVNVGASTQPLIINPAGGNVAIGQTANTQKLDVAGSIAMTANAGNYLYLNGGGDANWRIGRIASSTGTFQKTLVSTAAIDIVVANSANQGFAVGTNGGNSIIEAEGSTGNVYFRNRIGVGSSTPIALISAKGTTTVPLITLSSSSDATLFSVDSSGHMLRGGIVPTLGTCGGSPSITATSTDDRGRVTTGSAAGTTCIVNFSQTLANTPYCQATASSTSIAANVTAINTTSITFTFTGTFNSSTFYYACSQ